MLQLRFASADARREPLRMLAGVSFVGCSEGQSLLVAPHALEAIAAAGVSFDNEGERFFELAPGFQIDLPLTALGGSEVETDALVDVLTELEGQFGTIVCETVDPLGNDAILPQRDAAVRISVWLSGSASNRQALERFCTMLAGRFRLRPKLKCNWDIR